MHGTGRLALCAALILMSILDAGVAVADTPAVDHEIELLQREIDARGHNWVAKRNWTTDLSEEEFRALLGVRVPPEVARRLSLIHI